MQYSSLIWQSPREFAVLFGNKVEAVNYSRASNDQCEGAIKQIVTNKEPPRCIHPIFAHFRQFIKEMPTASIALNSLLTLIPYSQPMPHGFFKFVYFQTDGQAKPLFVCIHKDSKQCCDVISLIVFNLQAQDGRLRPAQWACSSLQHHSIVWRLFGDKQTWKSQET